MGNGVVPKHKRFENVKLMHTYIHEQVVGKPLNELLVPPVILPVSTKDLINGKRFYNTIRGVSFLPGVFSTLANFINLLLYSTFFLGGRAIAIYRSPDLPKRHCKKEIILTFSPAAIKTKKQRQEKCEAVNYYEHAVSVKYIRQMRTVDHEYNEIPKDTKGKMARAHDT